MREFKFYLLHPIRLIRRLYDVYLSLPFTVYRQCKALKKKDLRAEKLIVFIVPEKASISGGVLSIFSLGAAVQKLRPVHQAEVLLATYPSRQTYFRNRYLKNREPVFRLNQIKRFGRLKKIMIHLPEYYAAGFCDDLSADMKKYLQGIKEIHINILNQNIELMPGVEACASLRTLASTLTQTTAHDKYATQAICNRYGVPLHHFSVHLDLSSHPHIDLEKTEKVILLSPDKRDCRNRILQVLRRELPDYKSVTIMEMPFAEYLSWVARARFSITFGEGFDGYLIHAALLGRLCFAVYNDNFFPDDSFLKMGNIFRSYAEMFRNLAGYIRKLESDPSAYAEIVRQNKLKIDNLYGYDRFMDNQARFYRGQYDYYPESGDHHTQEKMSEHQSPG